MNYKSFFVTLAASVVSAVIAAVGTVLWLGVHCNVRVAEVGPGFVAYGCTNAVGVTADANNGTRLEILKRDDDLAFTSDGRLGFNDKKPDQSLKPAGKSVDAKGLYYKDATLHTLDYVRGNGADYTIPLLACPYVSSDWVASGGFYNCDDLATIPDAHLVYLHVSASGLILGIDNNPDCSGVKRYIQ